MNKDDMGSTLWVSWQEHRRTQTICDELKIPMAIFTTKKTGLFRYIILSFRTIGFLFKQRPRSIIAQNPSLVLCVLVVLMRPFIGFKLFIDAHNEAIEPYINASWPFRWVTKWLHKKADFTIVTNRALVEIVERNGGRGLVLPDGLPNLMPLDSKSKGAKASVFTAVLIATFVDDEPIEEVFKAFSLLTFDAKLLVTGNSNKMSAGAAEALNENIVLCGFLSENNYVKTLAEADLIIDLSKKPNCLVCGAYESIALERPVLLTDDAAGRELFDKGVVFTRNDTASVASAVERSLVNINQLHDEVSEMKVLYKKRWVEWADNLKVLLLQ